jgi:glucose-1-phosphate adenylyltransferase
MGIYVFDRDLLLDALAVDAEDPGSTHDFGRDVLPLIIRAQGVAAYPFRDRLSGAPGYWRDVGTLDSYWQAHMDLLGDPPPLDLNDSSWPIHTRQAPRPPARFAGGGAAARSIVAGGCEVAGIVEETVLATDSQVGRGARVTRSVVLPGARIGAGCRVNRAVVEPGCVLPDGLAIGEDVELDTARYEVTALGVALVTAQAIAKIVPTRETLEVA